MAELWIVEEKVTQRFLDEVEHPIKLDGKLEIAYLINAGGEDYVEKNKDFLLEFLICRNQYPLFVTFIVYEDQTEEYAAFLKEHRIEFSFRELEEKRTYYNFSGRHHYHPPCFTAQIKDSDALTVLLNEIYFLPAQNEFFSISFSDNLRFRLEEVTEWGRKRTRSIATFKIEKDATFITTFHDGAGFYLWSNEQTYFPVENLIGNLPKGTLVTQINDELVSEMTINTNLTK